MVRYSAMLIAAFGLAASAVGCDVEERREGELPDIEVEEGQLPEYDVQTPDIDVETRERNIEVPEIEAEWPEEREP